MDFSELSPKRRKVEFKDCEKTLFSNDSTVKQNLNGVCVTPANSTTNYQELSISGAFLCRFIDRLKIRTIPHISPLLERLTEAENKNIAALKSIDKINKRIKELECHVEKKIKTVPTSSIASGTDITDHNSEEYKRIINALQSSPFAPCKPPTSPACKPIDNTIKEMESHFTNLPKQTLKTVPSPRLANQQRNGHPIDLTNDEIQLANRPNGNMQRQIAYNALLNKSKPLPQKLDLLSAQYLPVSSTCNLLSAPTLIANVVPDGICLQWDIRFIDPSVNPCKYEICSFQSSELVSTNKFPWRKIGEVAALQLPMACTLTYVGKMNTYFFAIRAWLADDTTSGWSNVIMVDIN